MSTEKDVISKCSEVIDSCSASHGSNLNLVEMGLIKSVSIEDGHASITLRLTTPTCSMVAYLVEEVERSVSALSEVESVEARPDYGANWKPKMMTEEATIRRQEAVENRLKK